MVTAKKYLTDQPIDYALALFKGDPTRDAILDWQENTQRLSSTSKPMPVTSFWHCAGADLSAPTVLLAKQRALLKAHGYKVAVSRE